MKELDDELKKIAKEENNIDLNIIDFDEFEQFYEWQTRNIFISYRTSNTPCAYHVSQTNDTYKINIMLNNVNAQKYDAAMIIGRAYYRLTKGPNADIQFNVKIISDDLTFKEYGFNSLEFWIVVLELTTISFVLFSSIMFRMINQDIKRPLRQYMISCGLKRTIFWLGNFIVDFALLFIFSTVVFIIYYAAGIKLYSLIPGLLIQYHYLGSLTTLTFTYFFAFILPKRTIWQIWYTIICMAITIPILLVHLYRMSVSKQQILMDFGSLVNPFVGYITLIKMFYYRFYLLKIFGFDFEIAENPTLNPTREEKLGIIFAFISIPLWGLLLFFGEIIAKATKKILAANEWNEHKSRFNDARKKQRRTQEAIKMEEDINDPNNSEDYAIKAIEASKIFRDSKGIPVIAVNQVSLGIKRGSLFGFLGANGAGKTTFMKLILGEIPISHGSICVNGVNITNNFDPTSISICPQFDDHLTENLSGRQNMRFFCKLFNYDTKEAEQKINEIIDVLDYHEHVDKKISEMSGGNRRKCAVAISLLSRASIILLDEPTSSLDPIERHKVHKLINKYKGNRTFMLCTHILDEAESLSDTISIMMNGCIYTIGSPQYLSNKFGKEWKVDLVLQDDSSNTQYRVDNFFRDNLPFASASIVGSTSRIYSIPSNMITITDLFKILLRGKQKNIGIKYFTCSCSTLEKVFIEISKLSEQTNYSENQD